MDNCIFCGLNKNSNFKFLFNDNICCAIYDNYPVSPGHALIIPHQHISNYFNLSKLDQDYLWESVNDAKLILGSKFRPDGYNIGINCGETAGQSVQHVHIHLIPRYKGDVENPRGGVRHVIPGKGDY